MNIEEIPNTIVDIYKKRNMKAVTEIFTDNEDNKTCGCLIVALYATDKEIKTLSESELYLTLKNRSGLPTITFQGLLDGFDNHYDEYYDDEYNENQQETEDYKQAFEIGKQAFINLQNAGLVAE